jgi:hypothetical protein
MPIPANPICLHQRPYACEVCGKCSDCCECDPVAASLQHVDSKAIATRWRVLRIQAMDRQARR